MIEEMEPVNEDEEGLLVIAPGGIRMLGMTREDLDIDRLSDNTLVMLHWKNATLTMRAGALKVIVEEVQ